MTEYRSGSLYVVERPKSAHWVNRALKQLDDRLFLERQLTFDNQQVWCVVIGMGDQEPMTLLEFRDDQGNAIPDPTEMIVQRVARMDRGPGLYQRVMEKNRKMRERITQKAMDETREVALDVVPRISSTRSTLLPRGAYLRQSRDRQRARGEKV